jgi:hypothetical protein
MLLLHRRTAAVLPAAPVIVGDDADLILMALVSSTPGLYILNDRLAALEAAGKHKRVSGSTAVLSVDRLHSVWLTAGMAGPVQQQQQQQCSSEELMRLLGAKADLALLAIISSGNDYLPPVKSVPKLETLWGRCVERGAWSVCRG